ncbi:hypothetical protein RFI_27268 [Reticulomyxa filosa]|uniref:Uncharacterized protein n=1 Tax=Reticulomyxa filosa TaxID=46433 RepID=X6M7Z9_RETFI|nr:hypothetical protein RFI_27268 [Reticulomyxa filosa]|eukprot:ETO10108.1 hypothetical protein RFI_27268 [Reticulomyxa filosa]
MKATKKGWVSGIAYCMCSAMPGTQSVVLGKTLAIIIRKSVAKQIVWLNPFSLSQLLFVIICAFAWLRSKRWRDKKIRISCIGLTKKKKKKKEHWKVPNVTTCTHMHTIPTYTHTHKHTHTHKKAYWMYRQSEALIQYEAVFIVPMHQVMWITFSTIAGGLYFQEFENATALQWLSLLCGLFLNYFGLFQLMADSRKSNDVDAYKQNMDLPLAKQKSKASGISKVHFNPIFKVQSDPNLNASNSNNNSNSNSNGNNVHMNNSKAKDTNMQMTDRSGTMKSMLRAKRIGSTNNIPMAGSEEVATSEVIRRGVMSQSSWTTTTSPPVLKSQRDDYVEINIVKAPLKKKLKQRDTQVHHHPNRIHPRQQPQQQYHQSRKYEGERRGGGGGVGGGEGYKRVREHSDSESMLESGSESNLNCYFHSNTESESLFESDSRTQCSSASGQEDAGLLSESRSELGSKSLHALERVQSMEMPMAKPKAIQSNTNVNANVNANADADSNGLHTPHFSSQNCFSTVSSA